MVDYFSQYIETEVNALKKWPSLPCYQHVVCIPAFQEKHFFIERLDKLTQQNEKPVLCILVINQPESETDENDQIQLFNYLKKSRFLWQNKNLYLFKRSKYLTILVVERFQHGNRIPEKQGVGLARKIGADLASYLIHNKHIKDTQIFISDADAHLPKSYFQSKIPKGKSAITFSCQHIEANNKAIHIASLAYQNSIEDYVKRLQEAGSPYAFPTIGSCIAIDSTYYIKVRGFPKKSAGEDFYLLNKLNKIAPVYSLKQPVILIESRVSTRVPFGTGPAVQAILNNSQSVEQFYFPQRAYLLLANWLAYLSDIAENGFLPCIKTFFISKGVSEAEIHLISQLNQDFNAKVIINKILKNHHTQPKRLQALHEWFDALKTLQFVKRFR